MFFTYLAQGCQEKRSIKEEVKPNGNESFFLEEKWLCERNSLILVHSVTEDLTQINETFALDLLVFGFNLKKNENWRNCCPMV